MIRALLELQNAPADRVAQFRCSSCPDSVKKLRRCQEERFDFNENDGSFWPIRIQQGGDLYGFCPGKATWDARASVLYKALIVCDRTGIHWQSGGLADQPDWWVDIVAEFLPHIEESRFYSRARAILGDGKKQTSTGGRAGGGNKAGNRVQNPSRGGSV
jgi:hypothetical protein